MREGLWESSPLDNLPRPRVPKFIPKAFSEAEIKALLKACADLPAETRYRDIALILFLVDTGVGKNEHLELKMDDLQLDAGRAKVTGQGAQDRFVYVGKSARRALRRYMSPGVDVPLSPGQV